MNYNNYDAMFRDLMKEKPIIMREDFTTYFAYNKGEVKLFNTKREAMQFSQARLIEENFDNDAYEKAFNHYYEKCGEVTKQVIAQMAADIGYDLEEFSSIYDEACHATKSTSFDEILHYMLMNNKIPNYQYKHIVQKFNTVA